MSTADQTNPTLTIPSIDNSIVQVADIGFIRSSIGNKVIIVELQSASTLMGKRYEIQRLLLSHPVTRNHPLSRDVKRLITINSTLPVN